MKLKRVKILDFIIFGCILYTKISRMVIFRLVFLLYLQPPNYTCSYPEEVLEDGKHLAQMNIVGEIWEDPQSF